jgi:alkylation response protein AidB-like acyl-CoA dehydrogenase
MNFDLSETQGLFKATVERFCAGSGVGERQKTRAISGGVDRARWSELAALGLIGIAVAEEDGGLGGSLIDCAVVAEALGKAQACEPWLECGFIPSRLLKGTEHAVPIAAGSQIAALAFAETGGRYQLEPKSVQARKSSTGHILSGEKYFVLGGGAADIFVVTANLEGETALFAVPRDTVGVDVKAYPIADGSVAAVLTLRDVAVNQPLFVGISRFLDVVDEARLLAAAEIVGITQKLFDDTLDYVKTREQFGQPLGRFQVIQHRMVDCYAKVEQVHSALYRALLQPSAHPAGVKAYVAEEALWVAHQAVQLHGGMGMSDELGIGHGLKRIMLLSKLFGDANEGFAAFAKAA